MAPSVQADAGKRIAIIIPVRNEESLVVTALKRLQPLRERGVEVIVVDGQSSDATVLLATPLADRVIDCESGRAMQMNNGAAESSADWLVFLHCDTSLPENFPEALLVATKASEGAAWGFFPVRLSGRDWRFRVIGRFMNLRSRLSSIGTGDQVIFVHRELFEGQQGFADLPLMEDVELCSRLRRQARAIIPKSVVITSSRRWEQRGILRTVLLMWLLRLAWFSGVSASRIERWYR